MAGVFDSTLEWRCMYNRWNGEGYLGQSCRRFTCISRIPEIAQYPLFVSIGSSKSINQSSWSNQKSIILSRNMIYSNTCLSQVWEGSDLPMPLLIRHMLGIGTLLMMEMIMTGRSTRGPAGRKLEHCLMIPMKKETMLMGTLPLNFTLWKVTSLRCLHKLFCAILLSTTVL